MGRRIKLGDIYSFQLPTGEFVFVRVHQNAVIGIYKQRGKSLDDIPPNEEFDFFVCVYKHCYRNWHYVENRPFQNDEKAWSPPFVWVDQITGEGSLYYRSEKIPCTYDECKDLEILAVWDEHPLIDRLMGITKWQDCMKKPVPQDKDN